MNRLTFVGVAKWLVVIGAIGLIGFVLQALAS